MALKKAFVFFLTARRYLFLLCLWRQTSHLVWPGMAGLGQVLHRPAAFLSRRAFCAWRRRNSFRSAVWFLALSCCRCALIRSSAVLVGTLGWRTLGFLGFGFLTLLGFFVGSGLVISKRC